MVERNSSGIGHSVSLAELSIGILPRCRLPLAIAISQLIIALAQYLYKNLALQCKYIKRNLGEIG